MRFIEKARRREINAHGAWLKIITELESALKAGDYDNAVSDVAEKNHLDVDTLKRLFPEKDLNK